MSLLTRHILAELLKVMLLTCAVLVTVIAFGAAVRPLADDLLGPIDTLKYIGLAKVPMLQFALPFAAGFAATMVLHRMASDNELLAMSVSGLSYRRIFTPVAWLGILLAAVMLVLVNSAVPQFWVLMRATVQRDVTRLFVNRISQGSAFEARGLQIHADAVAQDEPPPGSGAVGRMRLSGVAAVQLDRERRPTIEFTAEMATVDVYRDESGTYLKPSLLNATVYRTEDGTLAFMPRAEPEAVRLADPLPLRPKYMTYLQIRRLRANPEAAPAVRSSRAELEKTLREVRLWEAIHEACQAGRAITMRDPLGRSVYLVEGARLASRRLLPSDGGGGTVRITEIVEGRTVRVAETNEVRLVVEVVGVNDEGLAVDMLVADATVRLVGDGTAGRRWPPRLSGLRVAEDLGADLRLSSLDELRDEARSLGDGPGPRVELRERAAARVAQTELAEVELGHEIRARLSQRFTVSIAAPLVLLLGATLAAWRRNAVPLAIYVAAFLPSIADILLIAGGEQMMKEGHIGSGLAVMWSGNVAMAIIIAIAWSRLRRN